MTKSYGTRNHCRMSDSLHPIRAYRQAQTPPMTLEGLAGRIGISKVSLSRIETGKQELSPALAKKVFEATGIPLRELRPDLAGMFEAAE